jgi:lethal(2) giant larvae protein
MFKFATNKFTSHGNSSSATTGTSTTTTTSSATPANPAGMITGPQPSAVSNLLPEKLSHTLLKHSQEESRRRFKVQQDLFAFNKIADKGFPAKPSAMDYDRKLRMLAVGTKHGDIRIYGQPNTVHQQLSCFQDIHPFPIQRLLFVQGAHQLITLSERSNRSEMTGKNETQLFLILWQIPDLTTTAATTNLIEKIKECQLDPKCGAGNSRLSALTLLNDNSHLFIGFETGDVYVFNVASFQLVPGVINKDYILKNIPAVTTDTTHKKLTTLGAVESICHHPRQLTKLLIAYQRGLWIIFDFIQNKIDQINQTGQQLESAAFYQQGECVATAHSDGSFVLWDLTCPAADSTTSGPSKCGSFTEPNIVYGPFPCKPVTKCLVKTCRGDQPYVIFSGGCPRAHSDKITISVIKGENEHVCFDFTSKIIDFFTVDRPVTEKTSGGAASVVLDNPQALFVLLEEEFVAIDLASEGWPQFRLPYLCSVHSSAIICTHHVSGVSRDFHARLKSYGLLGQDPSEVYSARDWPIQASSSSKPTPSTDKVIHYNARY